jgi:membrane protein YdbS with pleckstrin-like domain
MTTRSYYGTRTPLARAVAVILLIWLVIGAIAAGQRSYYSSASTNCAHVGTILVTIIAGPLNYLGANPQISCSIPQPSK